MQYRLKNRTIENIMRVRVKVCCIRSVEEAALAISYGASAIGLVSAMPSGPGMVPETVIAEVAASVPPPIATFLLTSETRPERIVEQQRRCATNTIQICDHVASDVHTAIRAALPGIKIVQVVHVEDSSSVDYAISVSGQVDALLLDSGRLSAPVKEFGGTGRTHDWNLSRQIRDTVSIPVFLAGGLNPANVAEAIRAVEPFGIDLCSGLREGNRLIETKLAAFFFGDSKVAKLLARWEQMEGRTYDEFINPALGVDGRNIGPWRIGVECVS